MSALQEAQERLARHMVEKGLKHTRQREEILEAFFSAGGHVSVEELLALAQARLPGVGHATVYRSMKLFVDAGVASARNFRDGQTRFEPRLVDEHHDHLICTDCGSIFEFEDPHIESRQAEIAEQHGLRLTSHRHEIYGSCRAPDNCPHAAAPRAGRS